MAQKFASKTAIVTGASRGIGLAVAQRLHAEGANVVITARKADRLEAALGAFDDQTRVAWVAGAADAGDHQDETVALAMERFGSIDLLVNNAGINPSYGLLMDLDLEAARKTLEVNVLAALAWTQKAYAAGLGDHGGAIVNIASFAALRPPPMIGFYGSSKAALVHLTGQMAFELGPQVRVNAVAPAVVKTRFAEALYDGREDDVAAAYPLRRLGVPEDVAAAVSFLLSDDAGWITGQTLAIDGGLSLTGGA